MRSFSFYQSGRKLKIRNARGKLIGDSLPPPGSDDPERRDDRGRDRGKNHEGRSGRSQRWGIRSSAHTQVSSCTKQPYCFNVPWEHNLTAEKLPTRQDFSLSSLMCGEVGGITLCNPLPPLSTEIKSLRLEPRDCIFWDYKQGLLLSVAMAM